MKQSLDAQLAKYLKTARGDMPYAKFAKKAGVAVMTLYRIEKGEHHITLKKLETVMGKLKIKLSDIFPGHY
jgi:transcriptional regulator with XRE-family HTH domain